MEETITIEQHFYGSAPVGLGSSRGFQTIAKSEGLDDVTPLEQHCDYARPPGRRTGEMPVNWGWFPLEEGSAESRVCIHRIGYAGTDEFGRPGNFLAHNLVVAEQDLQLIDYDVPSLIRWVRQASELRYPREDGQKDGFVQRNAQLYDRFGQDKPGLRKIPILYPKTKQIKEIRKQADRAFAEKTLGPLKSAIGRDVLESLLRTYLCDPAERKPIWVVGLSDGADQSSLELALAEFFFTLLPYDCRRRLTFATYHDVEDASPYRGAGRGGLRPDRKRRLAMMVPGDSRPTAVSSQAFVFDFTTEHRRAPPSARVSNQYVRCIDAYVECIDTGGIEPVKPARDLGSHFVFPDEMEIEGLEDCRKLVELARQPATISSGSYTLYHKLTEHLRTEPRPFPEFLDTAHRLIASSQKVLRGSVPHFEQLARDYARVLSAQYAILAAQPEIAPCASTQQIVGDLNYLFHSSLKGNCWDSVARLLSTVSNTAALEPVRKTALEAMAGAVTAVFVEPAPDRFASFWEVADKHCSKHHGPGRVFLARVAGHLCQKIRQGTRRLEIAEQIDARVLPILSSAPLEDPDDLGVRLEVVRHVCERVEAGKARKLREGFLVDLVDNHYLEAGLLEQILRNRHDLILRFYGAWQVAADRLGELGPPIQRVLDDPGLLAVWWNTPPDQHHRLLYEGAGELLRHLAEGVAPAEVDQALMPPYRNEGCRKLCTLLGEPVGGRSPKAFSIVSDAHGRLIGLIHALATRREQPPAWQEFHRHLVALCEASCLHLCGRHTPPSPESLRALFRPPLRLVFETCPTIEMRTRFFVELAGALCQRRVPETCRNLLPPPILEELRELCREEEEAHWYVLWIRRGLVDQGVPPIQQHEPDVLAELLISMPHLAYEAAPPGSFRQYVQRRLDDPLPEILGRRVLHECTRHARECLEQARPVKRDRIEKEIDVWFQHGSPKRALLEHMPSRGLVGQSGVPSVFDVLARDLLAYLRDTKGWTAIVGLNRLMSHDLPADLKEGARKALTGHAERAVHSVVERYRDLKNQQLHWYYQKEYVADVLWLCRPLAILAPEWWDDKRVLLQSLWEALGASVCQMEPEDLFRCFPAIFQLGKLQQDPREPRGNWLIWSNLFNMAAALQEEQPGKCGLVLRYMRAGDSLFAECRCRPEDADNGANLATLRWQISTRAWFERRQYVPKKTEDKLKGAMHRLAPRNTSEEAFRAVVARAQFAACVYAKSDTHLGGAKSDAHLGDIYSKLGEAEPNAQPSGWRPTNTAFALAGYVTLRGTEPGRPTKRAKELEGRKKFWKPLRRKWGGHAAYIGNTLEEWLPRLNVSREEAAEIAERFRKKLKTRFRFGFPRR